MGQTLNMTGVVAYVGPDCKSVEVGDTVYYTADQYSTPFELEEGKQYVCLAEHQLVFNLGKQEGGTNGNK